MRTENAMTAIRLLLAAAAACLATGSAAQDKVTVGLVSPLSVGNGGPIAFGRDLGFLKQEGIEIEYVTFNGSAVMLPQLAAKRVTVGWPNPDPIILSHDTGKDPLPVKMFFNSLRTSIWEFAVPADSKIREIKDLKGAKLGVFGLTSGNIPITRALLKEVGLDIGKDVELVGLGAGAAVGVALKAGRVDALNHFVQQMILVEDTGIKLRRLAQPRAYTELFSNGYATHVDTLRDNPAILARFGRVLARGILACDANPPACVRSFWKHFPDRKASIGATDEQNMEHSIRLLQANVGAHLAFPEGQPKLHGSYDAATWKRFIDILADSGQLQNRNLDPALMYSGAVVPEINAKLDAPAAIAAAKAAK
jgi:NitT/TauT family transport system substrate-binding protein